MAMRAANKNSRRQPKKLKFTIQKKAQAQRKRLKKLARTTLIKKTRRKDPGIPNSFPFKQQLLDEISQQKEAEHEAKLLRRKAAREAAKAANGSTAEWQMNPELPTLRKRPRETATAEQEDFDFSNLETDKESNLHSTKRKTAATSLGELESTACRASNLFAVCDEEGTKQEEGTSRSTASFYKMLNQVIQGSDIVLEILDARDPNACRCPKIENYILSLGKKLVFVLNKIDLVPTESSSKWLTYLRRVAPTVAFKSVTGKGGSGGVRYKNQKSDPLKLAKSQREGASKILGAGTLLQLLKNYSRLSGSKAKSSVTVGAIGYPNVGKSSVIKSLGGGDISVRVGGQAGVTRSIQKVKLDRNVNLLDCPGVIFSGGDNDPRNVLLNAVQVSSINDPFGVVEAIVARSPSDVLMKYFKTPMFYTANEFVAHVARSRGILAKGGIPIEDATSRLIVGEWTSGKIRHYCLPPSGEDELAAAEGVAVGPVIVSEFAKELDIEALWEQNDKDMKMQDEEIAAQRPENSGFTRVAMSSTPLSGSLHFASSISLPEDNTMVDVSQSATREGKKRRKKTLKRPCDMAE